MIKYFIKRWIKKNWGKRCADFEPPCGCCRAWKYYDYIFEIFYFPEGAKYDTCYICKKDFPAVNPELGTWIICDDCDKKEAE